MGQTVLLALVALATQALALFPCTKLEAAGKFYDLSALDSTFTSSEIMLTPPSTTNMTFYINPCSAITGEPACPEDAQVCMVQRVSLDDSTIVTQVKPFASQDKYDTRFEVTPHSRGLKGVTLTYTGSEWGNVELTAEISYVCGTTFALKNQWIAEEYMSVEFSTPAACDTSDSPGGTPTKPPTKQPGKEPGKTPDEPSDDKKKSGGWGFFTWVGFLLLMGFVAYAGFTLWINYREGGNSGRVDEWTEVLRDLPYLIRDFVRKIVGTFGTRGGYSAI